jgi:hypothetical protein
MTLASNGYRARNRVSAMSEELLHRDHGAPMGWRLNRGPDHRGGANRHPPPDCPTRDSAGRRHREPWLGGMNAEDAAIKHALRSCGETGRRRPGSALARRPPRGGPRCAARAGWLGFGSALVWPTPTTGSPGTTMLTTWRPRQQSAPPAEPWRPPTTTTSRVRSSMSQPAVPAAVAATPES